MTNNHAHVARPLACVHTLYTYTDQLASAAALHLWSSATLQRQAVMRGARKPFNTVTCACCVTTPCLSFQLMFRVYYTTSQSNYCIARLGADINGKSWARLPSPSLSGSTPDMTFILRYTNR